MIKLKLILPIAFILSSCSYFDHHDRKVASFLSNDGEFLIDRLRIHLHNYTKDNKNLFLKLRVSCVTKKLDTTATVVGYKRNGFQKFPVYMAVPTLADSSCGYKDYKFPINGDSVEISQIPFLSLNSINNYQLDFTITKQDKYERELAEAGYIYIYDMSSLGNDYDISLYEIPSYVIGSKYQKAFFSYEFIYPSRENLKTEYDSGFVSQPGNRDSNARQLKRYVLAEGDLGREANLKIAISNDLTVTDSSRIFEDVIKYSTLSEKLVAFTKPNSLNYNDFQYNSDVVDLDEKRAQKNNLKPCGLTGEISERIKDCNTSYENFSLITRTANFKEVYLDNNTEFLWTSIFNRVSRNHVEVLFPYSMANEWCDISSNQEELGNLPNVKWAIPESKQLEEAIGNGLNYVPTSLEFNDDFNINSYIWYWSKDRIKGYLFSNGLKEVVESSLKSKETSITRRDSKSRYSVATVRCVGKLK